MRALEDVIKYLNEEEGQVAVSMCNNTVTMTTTQYRFLMLQIPLGSDADLLLRNVRKI